MKKAPATIIILIMICLYAASTAGAATMTSPGYSASGQDLNFSMEFGMDHYYDQFLNQSLNTYLLNPGSTGPAPQANLFSGNTGGFLNTGGSGLSISSGVSQPMFIRTSADGGSDVNNPAPVPLPGAAWLLASGLLSLLVLGRRYS